MKQYFIRLRKNILCVFVVQNCWEMTTKKMNDGLDIGDESNNQWNCTIYLEQNAMKAFRAKKKLCQILKLNEREWWQLYFLLLYFLSAWIALTFTLHVMLIRKITNHWHGYRKVAIGVRDYWITKPPTHSYLLSVMYDQTHKWT